MIAAGFIIWTLLALIVGIVIGKAVAMADRQDEVRRLAARTEAQRRLTRVGGSWVA
jgi:hypothetical protein